MEDHIGYQHLIQDALRSVVRRALEIVAESGLPGQHHFYLSFRTDYPGVEVPQHLREQYPEETTIVLQHQFRDLRVDPDAFSVVLYFRQVPGQLVIPFAALTSFVDPSMNLALQFEPRQPETEQESAAEAPEVSPKSGNVVSLKDFRKK